MLPRDKELTLNRMHLPAEQYQADVPGGVRLIRGFLLMGFLIVLSIEIWIVVQVWQLWQ